MSEKCNICGRTFKSEKSLSLHKTTGHTEPYHDPEKLEELYHEEELSLRQIADRYETDHSVIQEWMVRHGIERRDRRDASDEANSRVGVGIQIRENGYVVWQTRAVDSNRQIKFGVHRLLAIAEYGADEVAGKDVHHKNNIPWDNRPENIEPLSIEEHRKLHASDGFDKVTQNEAGNFCSKTENDEVV